MEGQDIDLLVTVRRSLVSVQRHSLPVSAAFVGAPSS